MEGGVFEGKSVEGGIGLECDVEGGGKGVGRG